MATYLLFAGSHYYPDGGMDDFVGAYASEEEARAAFVPDDYGWAHIAEVGDAARIVARYRHTHFTATIRVDYGSDFPLGREVGIGPTIPAAWVAVKEEG